MSHLRVVPDDTADQRIALARSLLGHAEGHEERAIREALAALDGATVEDIARAREDHRG